MVACLPTRRWLASLALVAVASIGLSIFGIQAASAEHNSQLRDDEVSIDVARDGQVYTLRASFLVLDDGSGNAQRSLTDAKSNLLAKLNDTAGQTATVSTSAYVLNGFSWQGSAAPWSYNASGKPASLTGDFAAVQAAAGAWSSAGANFAFTTGGAGSGATGACSGSSDGVNTIGWVQQSGSVLAVTCSMYSGTRETEFDMQISPSWNWTTGSAVNVDLQSAVLHELGHAAGLGHSSDPSAVMYPSYTAGTTRRILSQDDLSGLYAIYGQAGSTTTTTATATATATPPPPTATAAPAKAAIASPVPGSTLPGASATFSWSAGNQALEYFLYAGTTSGANNLFAQSLGLNRSAAVSGIPVAGSTLYVRLWTRFSTGWQYTDYTYTEASPALAKATLLTPADGSTVSGGTATFSWTAGSGASQYFLYLGTSLGANNLFAQSMNMNRSVTLAGLPRTGSRVYVRIWTLLPSGWTYSDASFVSN